jgi:hypothetical protein
MDFLQMPCKVKLSRYMPWRHMGGKEEKLLLILNLSTRWGWVVSVMPRLYFTPGERTPGTHWIGGWVDPRASMHAGARRKMLCPCRGSSPDCPARSQTLLPELPRLHTNAMRVSKLNSLHKDIVYTGTSITWRHSVLLVLMWLIVL